MRATIFLILLSLAKCGEYKYQDSFHPAWPAPEMVLKNGANNFVLSTARKDARVTLLFFGFTHCPDICPTTLSTVAAAVAKLDQSELDRLRVVFVTVDPGRDTPDVASKYATGFHPSFIGLSGSREQVDAVIKSYAVYVNGEGTNIAHTSGLLWMNRHGLIRTRIAKPEEKDLLHDLKYALNKI